MYQPRIEQFTAWLREQAGRAKQLSVFEMMLSMAFIQGSGYVAQLFIAGVLGPTDFGRVRAVESGLAILTIPAALGMQTAAVRFMAATSGAERRRVFPTAFWISLGAAVIVAASTGGLASLVRLTPATTRVLRVVAWSLVFTGVGRVVISSFQGLGEIRRVAWLASLTAVITILGNVGGAAVGGVRGWVVARVLVEGVVACGLVLYGIRRAGFQLRADQAYWRMASFGAVAASSALLDRIATNADTLLLDALLHNSALVGQYGVASLLVTGASLGSSALAAVALPYLAANAADVIGARRRVGTLLLAAVALSLASYAALALVGPPILERVADGRYALAGSLLPSLSLLLIPASVMTLLGTFLLAIGRPGLALVQSVAGAAASVALNGLFIRNYGLPGAVWATVLTYCLRVAVLALLVNGAVRAATHPQPATEA